MKTRAATRVAAMLFVARLAVAGLFLLMTTVPGYPQRQARIPEGYELVARNGVLRFWMDMANGHFIVEDARSGKLWWSNPEPRLVSSALSDLWKNRLNSLFLLSTTDSGLQSTSATDQFTSKAALQVARIEDGVEASFWIPTLEVGFSIQFKLGGDFLQVSLPREKIRESPSHPLVSLDLLPYFGATSLSSQGYAFIPDGCGALAYFKPERRNDKFTAFIYGPDQFGFSFEPQKTESLTMPVFGLVDGSSALLSMVTEGDLDAMVNYATAGNVVDFNRMSVEFVMRHKYTALTFTARSAANPNVSVRQEAVKIDSRMTDLPRSVRYVFLTGEQAGYVGMATRYREYLMNERGVKRLSGMGRGAEPLNLRIFLGVYRPGLLLPEFVTATTFTQAQLILEELLSRGVGNIELSLVGWNRGGYDGAYPARLPVERKLGGESGLANLITFAHGKGVKVYLEDDYLDAFKGHFRGEELVKNGINVPLFDQERSFLLNAQAAWDVYAQKDIAALSGPGADGLDIRDFGSLTLNDYNARYPLNREQWVEYWLAITDFARKRLGSVAVQGGNSYVLGHVDRIYDAPMASSDYFFEDETVPFFQIVAHGLASYSDTSTNTRSDPRREFLRQIEYGARSSFELTYRDPVILKDTEYNVLFSSYYGDWLDEIAREYRSVNETLGSLSDKLIVDHTRLAAGVYETVYEDGTRIVVNYNEATYRGKDYQVDGLGYRVMRPSRE